ncbi:sugar ABC transporter ATP-binding protein [Pelagibacterium halotolerans]|uniref:sugar ABC transporter ATP-binding protein n=1 Tax=Pelagibacterium halotolerans TaxID=531813 RepID=UPI00384E86AC
MTTGQQFDLRLEQITKVYPGVVALKDVSLTIRAGEVIGLIGENGAGKSTLMKILGGILAPTAGGITIDGKHHDRLTVSESQSAGIAFVHQELNVLENLDVAANVFLGREKTRGRLKLVDTRAMHEAVLPLLVRVGARFKPQTPVATLSLAEQQLLEIAKALSADARLVIMDEPTSSLTLSETNTLLKVIADLKAQGIAVVFVSHRLAEIEACADRVVVLRDGRTVGHLSREEVNHDAMIRLMIGRDLKSLYTPPGIALGDAVLSIRNVKTTANPASTASFDVRRGEILGVAGLIGAGRTELAQAIFGVGGKLSGEVHIGGIPLEARTPAEAIAAGLYLVPEDRKRSGLILDFEIVENITMANLFAFAKWGMVSRSRQMEVAEEHRGRLAIKTPDVRRVAQEMSGGNQQKVVLAKWLSMAPRVVIFDEPTRGIDVGAKSEIYTLMRALADNGVGVMMISSDMEEVIGVSDRIVVMRDGAIAGELRRRDFSEHNILTLAVGKVLEEA